MAYQKYLFQTGDKGVGKENKVKLSNEEKGYNW